MSSINEMQREEVRQVNGGIKPLFYRTIPQMIVGAVASGAIKASSYYIESLMPQASKDTVLGVVYNGLVKGVASAFATLAIGVPGAIVVAAVQQYPIEDF